MSIKQVIPKGVHPPGGSYSHGVTVSGPGETLYISGQLGLDANGVLAEGFAGQAAQCWRNIIAILEASGMTAHNLIKTTTFLTDIAHAKELGAVREPFLGGARPASTIIATPGLVRPDWLIEIEAIAFRGERDT